MKKTVIFLLITILLVTLMVPTFAGQVDKCPDCSGNLYSIKVSHRIVSVPTYIPLLLQGYKNYYVETTTISCSNGTHVHQTRTYIDTTLYPRDATLA